ncbi:dihydropteroate synthase [Palleronia sp. LCG004]|uniref:dihydropteroate synthase n=1 Tax=Palleronia sp. LCG004 TaxID=3079304 RepID=UPI0029438DD3|nr:dihydropteroate synthase [Palleronia sp. LCG004]WOI57116.1 dihydropteroate synthase [Palleronia sp. LCG004]
MSHYRPLVQSGPLRPDGAVTLAGGWTWFTHAARLRRGAPPVIVPASEIPAEMLERLNRPRAPLGRLDMSRPNLMGILNTTPDSFSDGGHFDTAETAETQALRLVDEGADILDIGGESTRPGAEDVPPDEEIARILPAIRIARSEWTGVISVDTRKARVARAAIGEGADFINDVSAMADPEMASVVADAEVPVCLMHMQGTPADMQGDPHYDDVLLDVYDHLAERVAEAEAHGIPRERIAVDPGIGFGKGLEHNIALLHGLSLFHGLGCAILLGVSRKRFIGTIGRASEPSERLPGSLAVALAGIAQGVQITRVHDMAATRQALALWQATSGGST